MSRNPLIKKPWSKLTDQLIVDALFCLEARFYQKSNKLHNIRTIKDYVRLRLGEERNEVFAVLFLDIQSRLLSFDKLFYGTIDHVHIHSRVILQKALDYNASQVILAHNHPTGISKPSQADHRRTKEIKEALHIIDVSIRDHIIVSSSDSYSFAEHDVL